MKAYDYDVLYLNGSNIILSTYFVKKWDYLKLKIPKVESFSDS